MRLNFFKIADRSCKDPYKIVPSLMYQFSIFLSRVLKIAVL